MKWERHLVKGPEINHDTRDWSLENVQNSSGNFLLDFRATADIFNGGGVDNK